ncbi:MAG: GlxA family transcriptional regulator [Deltaproteobacteria bacterium]|nr:GlxA family transcriptional regulator [Deltaproteobacteria bacterium]
MKKITLLALNNIAATTVTGPMDVFSLAGIFWNYIRGERPEPYFQVEIVTVDGKPVTCLNGLMLQPHRSIDDVDQTDLILVSAIVGDIERTLYKHKAAVPWITRHFRRGTHIASVCTGAFLLAETGLLDGKSATTHWAYAQEFMRRYPQVDLRPERVITDEGTIFCSGAANSCFDLSFYLIEKYCGHTVAVECSKSLLHDLGRTTQLPYTVFDFQRDHHDDGILHAQRWIENNYSNTISIDTVAQETGMSRRTFERRFKSATGDTPLFYLQRVRIERAREFLETTDKTFDEISYIVGYEDSQFFRKIFEKQTGLLPREYRKKFRRSV